ncbi:MAG: glycosyltransferase [Desulfobacteraceae bacterium]|nr:glycosyltransferase [Desulfobacteraceae bacterium]MBC2719868.1 glycosyltransferase [Desulfobacteraceae bacterium]
MNENHDIQFLDTSEFLGFHYSGQEDIAVVMPCIDTEKGMSTARILSRRAGMSCKILIVHDSQRQGFIKTLNGAALRISTRYIVYLAQDAYPGRDWLLSAYHTLEKSGKGLLAFNDGKWKGRIASFGMVRTKWVKSLYDGKIFYPGYESHGADNELTVIARVQNMYEYNPDCTLVEYDPGKDFGGSNPKDKALFKSRFLHGFNGIVPLEKLENLANEYNVNFEPQGNKIGISIIIHAHNGATPLDRLLSIFSQVNTYQLIEFIIIINNNISENHTEEVITKYATNNSIRWIKRNKNESFANSNNLAVKKANYPYLLFLSTDIIYTSDVLSLAAVQLQDAKIGVVGIRLNDHPTSLPPGIPPGVQHTGIKFIYDSAHDLYRPFQLRLKTLEEAKKVPSGVYPAVNGAFLLCRKGDFEKLGGFCEEYDYGVEDIDFCLQIGLKLKKKCLCVNDLSLEHVGGDTQHIASGVAEEIQVKNLQMLNKRAGGQIKKFLNERVRSQKTFHIPQEHASVIKQTFPATDQISRSGVSIIILTCNGAQHLERLLGTFFQTNTHRPVELIIIDHGSMDNTSEVISRYESRSFIRLINRGSNYSFASSCNLGASNSSYPCLLFLNNDIIYTSDVLPTAMAWLADSIIGAVGVRLDDDLGYLPPGEEPQVQHTGITFEWDTEKEFYRPVQIRHKSLAQASNVKSGFYPAVTGAFLLCRKEDFEKLRGFCEEYNYGFEDIDFCLRIGLEFNKRCLCINDMSLQHVEGAARKQAPDKVRKARRQNNDAMFKRRMGEHVKRLMSDEPAPESPTLSSPRSLAIPASRINSVSLNILFVLYQSINSNGGLHVQLHAARLMAMGTDCLFAVPREGKQGQTNKTTDYRVRTFAQIEKSGLAFADGRGPNIIHAWTPREVVRVFCEKLLQKYPCPLVIHLEDNEEYLTEVTVGRPFSELARLPEKELDALIPAKRYHPIKGRNFLSKAQGLTLIIDTLSRFNYANLPSLVLPPPVDERLFYPCPLNLTLRKELGISDGYVVLAYTGNVHAGNRDEVRELYLAVHRLNEQGCPAILIRTGINAEAIGDEAWITAYEKNLGWVERSQVPDILAAADVLVQPGIPSPFNDQRIPSKLPEYFAMGRPIILPRTNLGLKVQHGQEGYVLDKADGEGIARAVLEINKDKEMAWRLADGGVDFYLWQLVSLANVRLDDYYRRIEDQAPKDTHSPRSSLTDEFTNKKMPAADLLGQAASPKSIPTARVIKAPLRACLSLVNGHKSQGFMAETIAELKNTLGSYLTVVPCVETALEEKRLPELNPWIGFVHSMPARLPGWLAKLPHYNVVSNGTMFSSDVWNRAKAMCRGLFVQSSEHAQRLMPITGVPVHPLRFPLPKVGRKWSWSAFGANPDKKVIQVGWWMQRAHAIYVLPVQGMEKIWIRGADPALDAVMIAEQQHLKDRHILFDFMMDSVTTIACPDSVECMQLLEKNIVFSHCYDANALDLVMVCIAGHTPILINPYTAIRDFLGNDYPLYYYFYEDAAEKAVDAELVRKAHEHLRQLAEKYEHGLADMAKEIKQCIEGAAN